MHDSCESHDISNLTIKEGGAIRGCKRAYAMFGMLNAKEDNAFLLPAWYSGTSKIIEKV